MRFTYQIYHSTQITLEEFLENSSDCKNWLNKKIAKDGISLDNKTDQYFQSLTLALQLFLQETADNAEIALSGLLGKISQVGRDAHRMDEDQRDAAGRVDEILAADQRVNAPDDDPKKTLALVNEAKDKIDLIRRALKRRK